MTDPRQLRAIVAAWWEDTFVNDYVIDRGGNYRSAEDCIEDIVVRARAALAQAYDAGHAAGAALERNPGSLMATEAMLAANPDTARSAHDYYTRGMEDAYRSVKDIVEGRLMTSIVIERPPAPPADGEMAELTGQLIEAANGAAAMGWDQHAQRILRAVELLQRQVLVPVPVSERLPLPEVNNG